MTYRGINTECYPILMNESSSECFLRHDSKPTNICQPVSPASRPLKFGVLPCIVLRIILNLLN